MTYPYDDDELMHGSCVLPDGFFDEVTETGVGTTEHSRRESELQEARDLAVLNPGKWIRVGRLRPLLKAPTAWVSEVKRGEKKMLEGYPGYFDACYWVDTELTNGTQTTYGKGIMFVHKEKSS